MDSIGKGVDMGKEYVPGKVGSWILSRDVTSGQMVICSYRVFVPMSIELFVLSLVSYHFLSPRPPAQNAP